MGMDPARRPGTTPTLGVPDIAWAEARAAAVGKVTSNTKWISVAPLLVTALNPVYQIAATLSMVATTGRFRARFTGYINNADGSNHNFFDGMSHGAGILVPTYAQFPLIIPPSAEGTMATAALIVDFPTLGFTAAPGSTTAINLLVGCDSASHISLLALATQFEVQEY